MGNSVVTLEGNSMNGLDHFEIMVSEMAERIKRDAVRFAESDDDLCMCCHAYGEDKRSLWIDCFYAVDEVIPEAINISGVDPSPTNHQRGYYLRICKSCRARFLGMMDTWWKDGVARRDIPKDHDGDIECETDPDRNIPVRIHGAVAMLTPAEWDERMAGRP